MNNQNPILSIKYRPRLKWSDVDKKYCFGLLFLILFVTTLFPSASPLAFTNYTMQADYLEFAKSILHGQILYTDLIDHKGLFLFLCYIPAYLFDRTGYAGVYLFEMAVGALFSYNLFRYFRLGKTKGSAILLTAFIVVLTRIWYTAYRQSCFSVLWR